MRTHLPLRVFLAASVMLVAFAVIAPKTGTAVGPTDAKTGFTLVSNGFAEEYCGLNGANQFKPGARRSPHPRSTGANATSRRRSGSSPAPRPQPTVSDRSSMPTGAARAICADPRRHQPDHGEAGRPLRRSELHRSSGRIAAPGSRDPDHDPGARAGEQQRAGAARQPQHPRRRIRRGDRQQHAARHRERAAGGACAAS